MVKSEFSQIKAYISQFISMTEAEWQIHEDRLTIQLLKKGEYLLSPGQVCNHVWFINKGAFRAFTIANEEEKTYFFAFENEYVTDYESFLTRQPSLSYIQALEDAEIIQLAYNDMQHCYELIPAWQKFGRLIAEYIYIGITQRASSLLLQTPEQLYVNILNDPRKLADRVPQHLIASYLGIKPESLSRIRSRLAASKRS